MFTLRVISASVAFLVASNPQLASATCVTQETQTANIDQRNNSLKSIAGVSASDVWAVGAAGGQLMEHFDGTTWSIVTPAHSLYNASLIGVSARASNDVWAVGTERAGTLGRPLNEHWDGSAWKAYTPPKNPHGTWVEVSAVSGNPANPNDVWAVGTYWNKDFGLPVESFAEHWDGRVWKSRGFGDVPGVQLYGISTVSTGEAWAVGSNTCARGCRNQPIIIHWDGTQWSVSAGAFQRRGILYGVSAVSDQDVWAIGFWAPIAGGATRPVIEHFDGHAWEVVQSPNPGQFAWLNSITAVSPTDAWAAGYYRAPFSSNVTLALLEHWNGRSWKIVPAPSSEVTTRINAIFDTSGSTIAVGESLEDSPIQPNYYKTFGFTAHC